MLRRAAQRCRKLPMINDLRANHLSLRSSIFYTTLCSMPSTLSPKQVAELERLWERVKQPPG